MKKFLSFLACVLLAVTLHAQQGNGRLDIHLNNTVLQPGDSLFVTVDYKSGSGQMQRRSLSTLQLIIENEEGLRTRLRWPVIRGRASGALYLPKSLAHGKYMLYAGLQERFFEVIGKVHDGSTDRIKAMLLTKTGDWDEQEVAVADDGTFTIRNWLFEDNALLAFSGTKNNNTRLNISGISTQLDSNYTPLAVAGRAFYVGKPPASVSSTLGQFIETTNGVFADRGNLLPAVVVRSTAKTRAEQYNDEYVSSMFRSGDERLISVLDDPTAFASTNIFSYLQGRVAGLQILQANFNRVVARWRGSAVTFFLDEIRVSADQIANIPMSDIAILKAYPPPFFGASGGGGGGGIAVYTRRGGEERYLPNNSQVFRVRGYSPSATVLDMNKLGL